MEGSVSRIGFKIIFYYKRTGVELCALGYWAYGSQLSMGSIFRMRIMGVIPYYNRKTLLEKINE